MASSKPPMTEPSIFPPSGTAAPSSNYILEYTYRCLEGQMIRNPTNMTMADALAASAFKSMDTPLVSIWRTATGRSRSSDGFQLKSL